MKRKVLTLEKRYFKTLTVLLLALLIPLGVNAQTGKIFDADKQLSSSYTNQVYLDRDGFIWVVTRNGLNRYDGYQFHTIKKEQNTQQGMASNYVNCMIQDRNGLFYMGMYGALQTYDGSRFENVEVKDVEGSVVSCYMTCFLLRNSGEMLAGTSGHGVLRIVDSRHASQVGGVLRDVHTVNGLLEDTKGHVWIVTPNMGLLEYDGKLVHRYFTDDAMSNAVRCLCLDHDGNIYVGTSTNGVYVRSAKGGEFRHLDVLGNKHIAALYCCRDGRLMVGFDGQGVAAYYPQKGTMEDNPYYSREVSLNLSKVYSIVEDANGNIWLGLLQKGVFMQSGETTGFSYMGYKLGSQNIIGEACVVSTCIDSKNRVWVGTDKDGLYCLDGAERRLLRHYKENFPATIMSVAEDNTGRIWIGSYAEGFGYIDTGGAYHKFPQYPNSSGFAIQASKNGDVWVATMGQGLLRITSSSVKAYTMQDDAPDNPGVNSIVNDYISKMSLSPDGKRVYLATTMGVCCLDIEKNSWVSTFGKNCLNYGTPCRVVKEYDGVLWVGANDGLFCYDFKQKKFHPYTADIGLSDNGIAAIERDRQGRLWIATDHGLCCHDPKNGTTRSYFVDNGLQSNEFSDGASSMTANGILVFGGVGGITWFWPEDIQQTNWDAKVSLVAFRINNQPVNSASYSGSYQICDTTVIAAERFELASHDNTFAIQFSTLTYVNPEHITYLYSINGEDFTRLQPGTNEITLTHMPPGTYHFCVKAERNGIQTPERCFTVVIHAPWYRSIYAYIIYILALLAALWFYLKARRRKEQDRLRLQEHIHAEEMADAKLKFFMNISHEIRTPMTLIVAPLLSLMKQDDDPTRRSVYETIRRNAERILGLINQMMDLRKIDKGQMQMRMCETDLIGFVGDIHTLFGQQAKVKNIQFTYEHDVPQLPVWIDRGNFDKVIVNILSNAFKFTYAGGKVRIRVSTEDNTARIAIYDDGEPIPQDQLGRIFDRFYQSPSSVNDRNTGTGIGLDLTRSLVELHHGTISVHNNDDGHGCEFVVTIPLGKQHLKPEEIAADGGESYHTNLLEDLSGSSVDNEEDQKQLDESHVTPVVRTSKRQRIVVVEDDEEIRDYLISELQGDYDITGCTNGRDGLAEVLKTCPDLVISDIMMPEMDGNTLCSKIKSSPTTSHVPVILLTAKNRDEDKLEGLETGADAYIVKPFNLEILRRTIINLINTHRMLQLKFARNDDLEQQVEDVKMKSPDDKLLERVMAVISKNLSNSDLSVDGIADEVGISRVHLHRKMKELTGQTPHDFIRNIRLKQAAHLLANQNMNITEVMYACGFNNSASFSTIFKKFYGLSPRDYMREHRKR